MSVIEKYSIKDVEDLTGISAYSLRAWEKRYRGLLPHRTSTNIRYYDAGQVRKLLNIATLMPLGYKASKLVLLSDDELNGLVLSVTEEDIEVYLQGHVNNLIAAMLGFDESAFDKIISAMIIKLGLYDTTLKVIYPFLRKAGVLWSTGSTSPAQEHFASHLLQRKIQSSLDALPCPMNTDKRFLLFLPPGQVHEIGLLFSEYLIRSKGHSTIYLGADLPYESLRFCVAKTEPTHLLTFFMAEAEIAEHMQILEKIAVDGECALLISTNNAVEKLTRSSNIHLLREPGNLFEYL